MEKDHAIESEIESQFHIRNGNLKRSFNRVMDSVDQAKLTRFDEPPELQADKDSSSSFWSRRPSHDITQRRRSSTFISEADPRAMSASEHDIWAMHQPTAEHFEGVAAKIDDMFGNNALTDVGPFHVGY